MENWELSVVEKVKNDLDLELVLLIKKSKEDNSNKNKKYWSVFILKICYKIKWQ